MKDFAKLLGSDWLIQPAAIRPLFERIAAATPDAVAAAVASYREATPTIIGETAVIQCSGPITHRCTPFSMWYGSSTIEGMQAQFRAALADPAVKTIVFRVDSPGGTVDLVPEFADEIYASREIKPTIAVSDTMIASAASWLFLQCGQVVVPRSGQVGSLGAYLLHQDISKMLDEWGIKMTFIFAGEHKIDGNPYEPLSDDARAQFQAEIDEIFKEFNAAVARARGVTTKVVLDTFGQGLMFRGLKAVKLGLADKVGTFDTVLSRLQGRKAAGAKAITLSQEQIVAGVVSMDAVSGVAKKADTVDPDDDGNCPDGYEKGDDGMCHLPAEDAKANETETAARKTDAVDDDEAALLMSRMD